MTVLGAYTLVEVAGRGATGEVWRAHDPRGNAVAVKLMRAEADALDEVRAVAALRHPNVVELLDLGQVPAGCGLDAGRSYLVMAWARHGALDLGRLRRWDDVRAVLIALLDALAYAHANDVVHRDVKPANVLLTDGEALEGPRVVLADFGIAVASGAGEGRLAGTPTHMAPEQFAGGPVGPAADLYALGVLAWTAATGAVPFRGDLRALRDAHLRHAPPAFTPRLPVPPGFEGWVQALLRKRPEDRFRCAADARHALAGLGGAGVGGAVASVAPDEGTLVDAPLPGAAWAEGTAELAPPRRSFPTWDEAREAPPGLASPVIAGRGIAHLREAPPVGRSAIRERLWAALSEAAIRGEPVVIALRGPSGVGTTHLARWIARRAHELGAADALAAPRLRELASASAPWGARSDDERQVALRRALDAAASVGPLVLVVDDAAAQPDVVAALEGARGPVLAVLTGREDGVVLPGERIDVPPLSEPEIGALIRALLPLDDELGARVEARAAGYPALAVEILRDWALRAAVQQADLGYRLDDEAVDLPERRRLLWGARAEEALRDAPMAVRLAAERAAVIGLEADDAAWSATCAGDGSAGGAEAKERLVAGGLARVTPSGLAFAHPLAREALLDTARRAGRLAGHHARAAAIVTDPDRLGEHLEGAGEPSRAVDVHLAAALAASNQARYTRQLELLDRAERLLDGLDEVTGSRRCAIEHLRAHALLQRGRPEEASRSAERAVAHARTPRDRAEALRRVAAAQARMGRSEDAVVAAEAALAGVVGHDPVAETLVRVDLAGYLGRVGRVADARRTLDGCPAASLGPLDQVHLHAQRAQLHRFERDPAAGLAAGEEALALARACDHRRWIGVLANLCATMLRELGRRDEAAEADAEALVMLEAVGSRDVAIIRLNLAIHHASAERWGEALGVLDPALAELRRLGRAPLVAGALGVRLWCLAGARRFADWDRDRAECAALLAQTGFRDPELARSLGHASRACAAAAEPGRAELALDLAVAQWRALGREHEAEALLRRVGD